MEETLNEWYENTEKYQIKKRKVNKQAQEDYEFLFAIFARIENEFSKKDLCRRFDRLCENLMNNAELGETELTKKEMQKIEQEVRHKAEQLSLF